MTHDQIMKKIEFSMDNTEGFTQQQLDKANEMLCSAIAEDELWEAIEEALGGGLTWGLDWVDSARELILEDM